MSAARPRCDSGGACAAPATWLLTAPTTDQPTLAACVRHLSDARRQLGDALLLLTFAERRSAPPTCEWLHALPRWPWVRRCTAAASHRDKIDEATVHLCGQHHADSTEARRAS